MGNSTNSKPNQTPSSKKDFLDSLTGSAEKFIGGMELKYGTYVAYSILVYPIYASLTLFVCVNLMIVSEIDAKRSRYEGHCREFSSSLEFQELARQHTRKVDYRCTFINPKKDSVVYYQVDDDGVQEKIDPKDINHNPFTM